MSSPLAPTLSHFDCAATDRNANDLSAIDLGLVKVTEAAARACAHYVGRGDKDGGDAAAVDAMREQLSTLTIQGTVVIGEGEKDQAPMLHNGERVGRGEGPHCDVAVDPVDGTTLLSRGQPGAVSVIALAERGAMFDPSATFYMDKIAVGPQAAGAIDLQAPAQENIRSVARALGKPIEDVTVLTLDRPRHEELIGQIRACGARVRLIGDGDVVGAILAATPGSGVDLMMLTGGTPEGVIAAAAMRCLGGELLGRLAPRSELEHRRVAESGIDASRVLTSADLVGGNDIFFCATGVTDGDLLRGVQREGGDVITSTLVMHTRTGSGEGMIRTLSSRSREVAAIGGGAR